jgi:2-polyprenyl-3-methyl-5-hydroxy-6-metoxy-1,4-benzoquinol methylase
MLSSQDPQELEIIQSWYANAAPWGRAIRSAAIASRETVTNQAIIAAICQVAPHRVFDVGCGEGWLARALCALGMQVYGVDVVPELIAQAVALGGAEFHVRDYAAIASREVSCGPFDAAVCNFSLLGHESTESLLASLPCYLADPGYLIIQTLHPVAACGGAAYRDGWRAGNWAGFGGDFCNPAPWYFRTLESWAALLQRTGFEVIDCRAPAAPGAAAAASIIWICKARSAAQT